VETSEACNNRLHSTLENYGYDVLARLPVQGDLVSLLAKIEVDIVIIHVYTLEPDVILGMKALNQVNPHPVIIVSQQVAHEIITLAVYSFLYSHSNGAGAPHFLVLFPSVLLC